MKIEDMRKEIDKIDLKIQDLLGRRGLTVLEIAKIKKMSGKRCYAPDREKLIFDRILKKNKGPMPNEGLKAIYREIVSACRNLEMPISVAYMGPEASFSHQAAMEKFGSSTELIPAADIAEVFMLTEKGEVDLGIVPVENSSEGVVTYTVDMFVDSPLKIINEMMIEVVHYLVSGEKDISRVKTIYSHPQVFGQTKNWLRHNFPDAKLIQVESTAEAARIVSNKNACAAITSRWAAKVYGLNVLRAHLEDMAHNYTRFLVVAKDGVGRTGRDKTSLIFSVKDNPGTLYHYLSVFARAKINLSKIESRPSKKKAWDYLFFIDLEGHIEDLKIKKALAKLEDSCVYMKVLGSYPRQ